MIYFNARFEFHVRQPLECHPADRLLEVFCILDQLEENKREPGWTMQDTPGVVTILGHADNAKSSISL